MELTSPGRRQSEGEPSRAGRPSLLRSVCFQPHHRAPLLGLSPPSREHLPATTRCMVTVTSFHHPLRYKNMKKIFSPSAFTGTFLSAGCTAKGALFCSSIHFLQLRLPSPHASHIQTIADFLRKPLLPFPLRDLPATPGGFPSKLYYFIWSIGLQIDFPVQIMNIYGYFPHRLLYFPCNKD